MTAPPVLRVSALTKCFFGTAAVDDLYLDVHEGEIVALIGPSGCGKSTLLRCLTWLEQPDDGFIEVTGKPFGRELTNGGVVRRHSRREIDALRPKIGIVFQQFNLWPHMTALENVVCPQVVVLGRPRVEAVRRGEELLARLRQRECELCETGTTVAVHQVTGLKDLGKPGPGQPAWAALMAKMRRKTLIVCANCHEYIHAAPVAHAA